MQKNLTARVDVRIIDEEKKTERVTNARSTTIRSDQQQ